MDNNTWTKEEQKQYEKRIDHELVQHYKRLEDIENSIKQLSSLTISVEKIAVSVEMMAKELGRQGERLDVLEGAPARDFNTFKSGVIGAIASAVGCAIVAAIVANFK